MQWRSIYLSIKVILRSRLYIILIISTKAFGHRPISCKFKSSLVKCKSKKQTNSIKIKWVNYSKLIKNWKITNNRILINNNEESSCAWIY